MNLCATFCAELPIGRRRLLPPQHNSGRNITGEIIANQLAVPLPKEVACMLTRTARAEVVNHCFKCRKRRCAVGPDISTMGFLFARREHLHWGFVCVNHALGSRLR